MSDSRTVTREALHALVWQRPMRTLAAEFGLSDVGLAKLCRRLDVPRPGRGYWAQLAVGKAPAVVALPERGETVPGQATVRPTVAAPAITDTFNGALARLQGLKVPERLGRPHPVIAGWLARKREALERAREHHRRWGASGWSEPDFTSMERRIHRILDALYKALERAGGKVAETERREVRYQRDGVWVALALREKHRVEHQPLPEEERRRSWNAGKTTRRMLAPTGRLICEIRAWGVTGLKTSWVEKEADTLEGLLPEIAASVLAAVPQLIERERQREAERRHWEDEGERRRAAEALARREAAKWARLVELAGEAREVELVRALLARLGTETGDLSAVIGDRSLGAWLAWAEAMIARRDPLRAGAGGVFEALAEVSGAGANRSGR